MVEGDGLENRYTLTGIEGSNPSLSAILSSKIPEKVPFSTVSGFLFVKTRLYWLYPANPKEG